MILKGLVVGAYCTNCYIVGSESTKEGIVIDPGDEPEKILKSINAKISEGGVYEQRTSEA